MGGGGTGSCARADDGLNKAINADPATSNEAVVIPCLPAPMMDIRPPQGSERSARAQDMPGYHAGETFDVWRFLSGRSEYAVFQRESVPAWLRFA
jgi:hypothetical protein